MGFYGFLDSELSELKPFVEFMVSLKLLPEGIMDKIKVNNLNKSDLSKIQHRIDGVLCGSTLERVVRVVSPKILVDCQQIALRAHSALMRRRKYDWKRD